MHPDVKSGGIRPRYNPPAPARVVYLSHETRMLAMRIGTLTNQGYHRRAGTGGERLRLLSNFDCVERLPYEHPANA